MLSLFLPIPKLIASKNINQILVVFQNNNELRGGGGFITQLLDISIGQGKIRLKFRNDHEELRGKKLIEPPEIVKKYLEHKHWHLRDTNIFGDFKKNAESLKNNYCSIFENSTITAIIAVNFTLVEKILQIYGTVKLREKDITSQNIFTQISTAVSNIDRHDLEELKTRKSILKEIFSKLSIKIIRQFWKLPILLKTIKESIKTKDLQIHYFDQIQNQKFQKKGLIEEFSSNGSTDYLGIIENNFLGLKTNRYLRRIVFHDVQFTYNKYNKALSDANITVKIRTDHFGSFNYPISGTYQSLTTVFIPKSAKDLKILTNETTVKTGEENEFKTLEYHKVLPVSGSSEFTFQYSLPASLFKNNTYSFHYIKQSGVQHEHIHEVIKFPEQYTINSNNKNCKIVENELFIDYINTDRSYEYKINGKLHLEPPRIYFHEIIEPSTIQIRFNEPIFFIDNEQKQNQILVINPKTDEFYKVEKVSLTNENRHLIIHIPQLPKTEEAFYQVYLSNIKNSTNIELSQPKKLTVVYRSSNFNKK